MYSAIRDRFLAHINSLSFSQEQDAILNILKRTHTERVVELSEELSSSLFVNDRNRSDYVVLAKIIAVLHDVARWEQMRQYGGFSDTHNDHGELGAEIIIQNDMLQGLEDIQKQIVLTAIREHNQKYAKDYDPLTQAYVNIIRDADKIDNFYIEVENYGSKDQSMKAVLPFSDEHRLSPHIYDCIMNQQLADSRDRETMIDFKFFKMAWCFDIKINRSFELIQEKEYLQKIYSNIPTPDIRMRTAYEAVSTYLGTPRNLFLWT